MNARHHHEIGSTAIEFALVTVLYFTFILFIIDIARFAYAYNVGSETAMIGARYAIVCSDKSDTAKAQVLAHMQGLMPEIQDVELDWVDADGGTTCSVNDCAGVTVRITDLTFDWASPILGVVDFTDHTFPEFATYLPRESMRQDDNSNDLCTSTI